MAFKPDALWNTLDAEPAYRAYQTACASGKAKDTADLCSQLKSSPNPTPSDMRAFFKQNFEITKLTDEGLLTAYYLPLLSGSYQQTTEYNIPVWGVPKDFKQPYLTRRQIDQGALDSAEKPLLWTNNKADLFFLHVQGSGIVHMRDGSKIGLGFAAKNGQPYESIGKLMVAEGLIDLETASMQTIKAWLNANPSEVNRILWHNNSYVFFRKQPAKAAIGAQNIQLTAYGSAAVDPNHIAYGTPVLMKTVLPNATQPSLHLAIAQDTGSAIKSEKRVDWFLGYGHRAENLAGNMKQPASFYQLTPKNRVNIK